MPQVEIPLPNTHTAVWTSPRQVLLLANGEGSILLDQSSVALEVRSGPVVLLWKSSLSLRVRLS